MKALPHTYTVKVEAEAKGNLTVRCENLQDLTVAPPSQFGGPGDLWSPEDLFMASVANCLVLSFRAIARASKLEWVSIECESDGELSRVESKMQFTGIVTRVKLLIPASENAEKAEKLLHKAEDTCLISNSLNFKTQLECEIVHSDE